MVVVVVGGRKREQYVSIGKYNRISLICVPSSESLLLMS